MLIKKMVAEAAKQTPRAWDDEDLSDEKLQKLSEMIGLGALQFLCC